MRVLTVLYILCIINAHVDSLVWMTAQICEYLSTQYLRKCCTYLGIIVWPQISSSYKDGDLIHVFFLLKIYNLTLYLLWMIHARMKIEYRSWGTDKSSAFPLKIFFSFILCAYFVCKDKVECNTSKVCSVLYFTETVAQNLRLG